MAQLFLGVTSLLNAQLQKVPYWDWVLLGPYAGAAVLDWRMVAVSLVLGYLVWEQAGYWLKRKHLPGPAGVPPLLGNVVAMVQDPAAFWKKQASYGAISWNALAGKYIVFVKDPEMQHKIFSNVHAEGFQMIAHPFGKKIFGKNNMIMMWGEQHKVLRGRLLPLFTLKALGAYVEIQECTIRAHLSRWLALEGAVEMRLLVRALNLETSQTVFVGPYLTPQVRATFKHDYSLFNNAVMAFPVDLPGTNFNKGARAVTRIVHTLSVCCTASKARMFPGAEPACLMDYWTASVAEELQAAQQQGAPIPEHCSDEEIGQHVFDFLFAAQASVLKGTTRELFTHLIRPQSLECLCLQDASSSSLLWVMALLEAHPDVLARVREEQRSLRPDRETPLSADLLAQMKYTKQVVLEVLRLRPPAPYVPHIAAVDFPLTPDYTVPKGTIVFPSVFDASFQGFTDPHRFDPDRFSPERREDVTFKRNWLLFGAGPHQCMGQRYAINHIMVFISLISSHLNWERLRTLDCDNIAYQPTIYPKDGVLVKLSKRNEIDSSIDL